jgi:acyl-CoA dehydrogenase
MTTHTPIEDPLDTSFTERLECWLVERLPALVPADPTGAVHLRPIVASLADKRLLASGWPQPWGSGEVDRQLLLHRRLAGQPHGAVGLGVLTQIDIAARILREHATSPYLRERLSAALAGRELLALGLTEPEGGSDLRAVRTQAKRTDGGWRLAGAKWGISNLAIADACIVLARTGDPARPIGGFTLFLVPRTSAGVAIGPALDTPGHPGALGQATFTDVVVPEEAVVGQPGQGLLHLMASLAYERVMIAARALGACEAMLAEGIRHARERKTFGRALIENQHVQFKLAEWRVGILGIESELLALWADVKRGAGDDVRSAALKYNSAVLARTIADDLLQLSGGAGYVHESPAGRYWLDLPGLSFAGGTNEVMLSILARRYR